MGRVAPLGAFQFCNWLQNALHDTFLSNILLASLTLGVDDRNIKKVIQHYKPLPQGAE